MINQVQVHRQMVKMLSALPSDVPVAVFLLGYQLRMLQNFTTDPALLKAALQKAASPDSSGLARIDPRDDPNAGSAFLEDVPNVPATFIRSLKQFEQETYASNMDVRVRTTAEALVSIARHVTGYPGRKNLLWISSSFPIILNADTDEFAGFRSYESQMQQVASVLGDAKIAVYPIDPAGLETSRLFDSGMKTRREIAFEPTGALERESQLHISERGTMDLLATQTGGKVCVQNNDLGDCVQKAVNDSSAFYEIAYYPDKTDWNGEFRHITVKTTSPGLHLAYREGYFATPDEKANSRNEAQHLQQAACDDYLTSTSIILASKMLARASDKITYSLVIAPSMLSFVPVEDDKRELKFTLASCSFDKSNKPIQLVIKPIDLKFTDKQYQAVIAARGLPTTVAVPAKDNLAWVRLLIKDSDTGHLGSVNVPLAPVDNPGAPH
jgi:VWFA-related protein